MENGLAQKISAMGMAAVAERRVWLNEKTAAKRSQPCRDRSCSRAFSDSYSILNGQGTTDCLVM